MKETAALPQLMHLTPEWGKDRTRCCGALSHEIPENHEITNNPGLVTCKGIDPDLGDIERIIARRAALIGRSSNAFRRLMGVREALTRASSSAISPELRNELMDLIDRG